MSIPYTRHSLDQPDIDAVERVLRSDWLTQGPEVSAFERDFAAKVEAPYAVSFSSGTAALHAACFVAGVDRNTDVVTSALTFVASANAARYCDAKVRFCDIDPESFNATLPEADVAIPVHFAGLPAKLPKAGIVIEDACHALGARTADGPVGNCAHSDMCAFSLHPAKAITAGEGGMVTTRSESDAWKLRRFRNHGFELSDGFERNQVELGLNYRMSDIHAALGRSQLRKLDGFIARRHEIAGRYLEELNGVVELPPYDPGHAWHLFIIRTPKRNALYHGLKERGIQTQVHYRPVPLNGYYGGASGQWPNAEAYYREALSLPCFPGLGVAEQGKVIEAVRDLV